MPMNCHARLLLCRYETAPETRFLPPGISRESKTMKKRGGRRAPLPLLPLLSQFLLPLLPPLLPLLLLLCQPGLCSRLALLLILLLGRNLGCTAPSLSEPACVRACVREVSE